jgi:hypothetical protein
VTIQRNLNVGGVVKSPRNALATIELFRPEVGGRSEGIRPRRWLATIRIKGGTKRHYSVGVDIDEELRPGEVRQVFVAFGFPDLVLPLVKPGTEIFYCEGHAVGKGTILELYPSNEVPE